MAKIATDTATSVSRVVPSGTAPSRATVAFIASACSRSRLEPDVLGEIVAHEAAERDRAEPFYLGRQPVDQAEEHGNADAAALVDDRLHVPIHLLALRLIALGPLRLAQLGELLVLPAASVPPRVPLDEQ